ncbi:hypothetical protein ETU08_05725 [Apibacter muscae]|uniref:hypothetical protein n=1 Tax=Apibacter muscae TaxID=2509004 RepID=UPI0011ABB62C|nr:hypothetical protein [Apibacter muscae]TWP30057.1 hypothetical protein ETU08_05725 [Apibacter muscae]
MKKLLLFLLLSISGFISAQMQDLATLASGKLVYSQILLDTEDQVYGYIYFFNQENIDEDHIQMEYVLLDKNLNRVANHSFKMHQYNKMLVTRYFRDCSLINNNQLLLRLSHQPMNALPIESFSILSIKEKTISPEFWYYNDAIEEIPKSYPEYEKKAFYFKNTGIAIPDKNHNGFYIKEQPYTKVGTNKFLKFYDLKNQLQWSYEYNTSTKNKEQNTIYINNNKSETIYLLESNSLKKDKIVAINSQNGKIEFRYTFDNNLTKIYHDFNSKVINNQFIITGNYYKYEGYTDSYNLNMSLGFYRIIIDKNGNKINEKYIPWEDLNEQININKNGKVDKKYFLRPNGFYIFEDGSVCFLTDKYQPNSSSSDFVLFFMDPDFKLKKIETIAKEPFKGTQYNYLFSQFSKEKNEYTFFYKNYITSNKEWVLGVVTLNKEGIIKEDKIPMSSKDEKFTILPIPAKEGYILLREYNENDEKYNQLRLEKLN